ncbi:MAG: leucine--tRNA ligase [Parcubacteria group bacterium]|nr:leucine--tRNA ligase [Parcubacteria group bacterium]
MKPYDHNEIEPKWQREWAKADLYRAEDFSKKPKSYLLVEFPYPSGDGLHTGHVRSYAAMDAVARKRRMEGQNILYPIGWDAFGLPTENYAIKTGIHPSIVTKNNSDNFRRQLKALGLSFDWSREINTTDPAYYKWTQWIFLKLFKRGLAYKKKTLINWCPSCKIGLANEEVVEGACERCGTSVTKREKEQWMLAITKYAERLYKDLDEVDYVERVKVQQRNWIGPSEGLVFNSPVKDTDIVLETFSAHFEAFCADTFLVIAPDHPRLPELLEGLPNKDEILLGARKMVEKRTVQEERGEIKEVEGIFTGRYTIDPVGNGELPLWIASYALADYGTGVVKCSAHDERDFAFAKKYGIRLKPVLFPEDSETRKKVENLEICFSDMEHGILSEPPAFRGKSAGENRNAIADYAVHEGLARKETTYKLRDWVFSRQRYWGEPIPIIHCEKCGIVPVPESELPVVLPDVENYKPGDTGESPLANILAWVNVKCPACGGKGKRETDVMPNWAGSSWYWLRYADPHNKDIFADSKKLSYWTPVDWYNGGMEHTTLHLLYSRFWHKALFDEGLVPTNEPYRKRTSHGLVLAEGGVKMSKSKGNVVNPDDVIAQVGADTLRVYEMFMGPFEEAITWNTDAIAGSRRFLERVWRLKERIKNHELGIKNKKIERVLHKTIKKVSEDIENLKFNTAISALMIFLNELEKENEISLILYSQFLILLSPFAPHIAEELWRESGGKGFISEAEWPRYESDKIEDEEMIIIVQVDGRVRDTFQAVHGATDEDIKKEAQGLDAVRKWIEGTQAEKIIYVPGKLVNIVTKR